MINEEIRHIVEAELEPGEELLWAEKPSRFPVIGYAVFGLIFTFFWCLFVLVFIFIAIAGMSGSEQALELSTLETPSNNTTSEGAGMFSLLFLILPSVFLLFGIHGLYQSIKQFIGPSRQAYALTSKRAIIFDKFLSNRIVSLQGAEFSKIERRGSDQIGSLQFGKPSSYFDIGMFPSSPLNAFLNIPNPKSVETLIRKTFLS